MSPSTPPSFVLTVADTARRLEVEVPPSPRYVNVRIDSVDNPRRQGFGLAVSIELNGLTREVGQVSPFPADTAGTFVIRLSDDTAGALRGQGRVTLVVTLVPATESESLVEDLKVTVKPPELAT